MSIQMVTLKEEEGGLCTEIMSFPWISFKAWKELVMLFRASKSCFDICEKSSYNAEHQVEKGREERPTEKSRPCPT